MDVGSLLLLEVLRTLCFALQLFQQTNQYCIDVGPESIAIRIWLERALVFADRYDLTSLQLMAFRVACLNIHTATSTANKFARSIALAEIIKRGITVLKIFREHLVCRTQSMMTGGFKHNARSNDPA